MHIDTDLVKSIYIDTQKVKYIYIDTELVYSAQKNLAYELSTDESYYIVKGLGDFENTDAIAIPATYKNKPVKEIANDAFTGTNITSITIDDSVTTIGNNAFNSCKNLTEVVIPDSVTSIGRYAFQYCEGLTEITIPENVENLGSGVFGHCYNLSKIFYNAREISNNSYESGFFTYAGRDTEGIDVTIGSQVKMIPRYFFSESNASTSNTNRFNIKTITFNSNSQCTTIGHAAFLTCDKLTSIYILNSVTSIGSSAFKDCRSLTEVSIGKGVASIGDSAFSGCSSLTSVTIPNNVTSIGAGAFSGCTSLERLNVNKTEQEWIDMVTTNQICSANTNIYLNNSGNLAFYPYELEHGTNKIINYAVTRIATTGTNNALIPSYIYIESQSDWGAWYPVVAVDVEASKVKNNIVILGGSDKTEENDDGGIRALNTNAFSKGVTTVVIPSTVTTIKNGAFGNSVPENIRYEGIFTPLSNVMTTAGYDLGNSKITYRTTCNCYYLNSATIALS